MLKRNPFFAVLLCALAAAASPVTAWSQCTFYETLFSTERRLDKLFENGEFVLDEVSGLAASRKNPDVLWVHNDSGGSPRVFALNAAGDHLGIYNLNGAQATDYEDIAIGPGPTAGTDYLYVADTGNNSLGRSTVTVYRVPEPAATSNQSPVDVNLSGVDALPS